MEQPNEPVIIGGATVMCTAPPTAKTPDGQELVKGADDPSSPFLLLTLPLGAIRATYYFKDGGAVYTNMVISSKPINASNLYTGNAAGGCKFWAMLPIIL